VLELVLKLTGELIEFVPTSHKFVSDTAIALGIPLTRIQLVGIAAGSVIVTLRVAEGLPAAAQIAEVAKGLRGRIIADFNIEEVESRPLGQEVPREEPKERRRRRQPERPQELPGIVPLDLGSIIVLRPEVNNKFGLSSRDYCRVCMIKEPCYEVERLRDGKIFGWFEGHELQVVNLELSSPQGVPREPQPHQTPQAAEERMANEQHEHARHAIPSPAVVLPRKLQFTDKDDEDEDAGIVVCEQNNASLGSAAPVSAPPVSAPPVSAPSVSATLPKSDIPLNNGDDAEDEEEDLDMVVVANSSANLGSAAPARPKTASIFPPTPGESDKVLEPPKETRANLRILQDEVLRNVRLAASQLVEGRLEKIQKEIVEGVRQRSPKSEVMLALQRMQNEIFYDLAARAAKNDEEKNEVMQTFKQLQNEIVMGLRGDTGETI